MRICKEFKRKILDFIEHHMDENEYKKFEEHLNQCSLCQKEHASLMNLYGVLEKDEVILPENEFFENLKVRVRQKDITPQRSYIWKISRVLAPVVVATAIVLMLYRPEKTMEISIPLANLLADKEFASYALDKIIDDTLINELTEVEDHFLLNVDEALDELSDDEKQKFIKGLYKKYGFET